MSEQAEEAVGAVETLARYVDGEAHDPGLWSRVMGAGPIRELAEAEASEVDGLLLQARGVVGSPKTEIAELRAAVVRERKAARRRGRQAGSGGEVVGMDGQPVESGGAQQGHASITAALEAMDCPDVVEGLRVPSGYVVTGAAGRVYAVKPAKGDEPPTLIPVSPTLIALIGRVRAVSGREWLTLTWRRAGRWQRVIAPREVIADRVALTTLIRDGLPADAGTMREVQVWIARQEGANMAMLPESLACETMGWVDPKRPGMGFVVGDRVVGAVETGTASEVVGLRPEIAALTGAYQPAGTWEGWIEGVWAPVARHPIAAAMMYLGMAAPLLALVPSAGAVVGDLGGKSSSGKSVCLEAVQSAGGHPQDGLGRWDGTAKGIELRGRQHGGIPLVMDDSKEAAKSPEGRAKITQTVYCYTSTGTRSRTGQDGRLETLGTIRGILLTGGETPVADLASDSQGAIARLLSVRSLPWGEQSERKRAEVDAVRRAALIHHGHALPRLVAWLARRSPEEIERMRARYIGLVEDYQRGAGDSGPAQRIAAHLALVHLAGLCCASAWGVPFVAEALSALAAEQVEQVQAADMVSRGYGALESYIGARESQVVGLAGDEQIRGEVVGRWWSHDAHPMISEAAAARALEGAGLDVVNVLRQLRDAGWIDPTRQRMGKGARTRGFWLMRTARD
jgi:hypothetical protein